MVDKNASVKRQKARKSQVGIVATKNRDNFTEGTRLQIRDMAGNVCSMPECHVHTHGSKASRDGALNIGVACHIRAAAPGGPRYDASQTPELRKHEDNGIWMCQTHSRLIDVDDSPYPPETLLEWKRLAEIRANAMVNKRALTQAEASDLARAESIALLDRYTNRTSNPIEYPIAEMWEGYEAGLNSLDPRFQVKVERKGKSFQHAISPVGNGVSIQLIISGINNLAGFKEGEKALFEEGRELVIPSPNFKFEGSKLFDAIHQRHGAGEGGSLTLGAVKKPVKTNVYACDLQGHELLLDSFTSYSITGAVRTVIEGECLGGLLVFKTIVDHADGGSDLSLTYDLESWRGIDILEIPLFFRLSKALPYLEKGHLIIEFEFGNAVVRFSTNQSTKADAFVGYFHWIIRFMDKARQIAGKCSDRVLLAEMDFSPKTFKTISKYSRLLEGPLPGTRKPSKLCVGDFDSRGQTTFEDLFNNERKVIQVKAEQEPVQFALFGRTVTAPRISTSFTDLDCFFYCPLDDRAAIKLELHTMESTLIEHALVEEDIWTIHN